MRSLFSFLVLEILLLSFLLPSSFLQLKMKRNQPDLITAWAERTCLSSEQEKANFLPEPPSTPPSSLSEGKKETLNFDLLKCPHQPIQKHFGPPDSEKRRAQSSWFENRPWLHYDIETSTFWCFPCTKAHKLGLLRCTSKTSLVLGGWSGKMRKALDAFKDHQGT